MKIIQKMLWLALVLVIGAQCTGKGPDARIRDLEKKISDENFTFDLKGMQLADDLINAYIQYAEDHKTAAESPEFLYNAAELSLNLNRAEQALSLYNRIIYQYPEFDKVPECLFLVAFIYENNLQNFGKAKELYEAFIERYPDHDFADDAAISIQNMGKTPEELIREFEERARLADTASHS